MAASEDLIGAACASLTTLAEHVSSLSPSEYTETAAELSGASIGMHVRHCLDHFAALRRGLPRGRVDYDERERAVSLECDRDCAARLARELAAKLRLALRDVRLEQPVLVRTASSPDGEVAWQPSSVGRELQFLVSHTVHHAAMIAASCRIRGLSVAEEHGVAPSTLRHRTSSC
ncbi:MAG: DinB family protein [Planctomycetota bacterium]